MESDINKKFKNIHNIFSNIHINERNKQQIRPYMINLLRDKIMLLQRIICDIESNREDYNDIQEQTLEIWCKNLSNFQDSFINIFIKWMHSTDTL